MRDALVAASTLSIFNNHFLTIAMPNLIFKKLSDNYYLMMCLLLINAPCIYAQNINAGISNIPPGTIVAYSPASSGLFIGSPSIAVLPNGNYVASHDFFGPNGTENSRGVSRIYKSVNKGKSWQNIAEIKGQFWSKLFLHKKVLYILGTWKEYGNIIIRKSLDGGNTWTEPIDNKSGLLLKGAYHCAPMPVINYKGRLWRAMEDAMGPMKGWGKMFGSFMMSVSEDADLLDAENWISSNTLRYDSTYLSGYFGGWLEGNAVVTKEGNVVNILRTAYDRDGKEKAAIIKISEDGKNATFNPDNGFINFPGGSKKFAIHYDLKSKLYYTLSNYIPDRYKAAYIGNTRNVLALCSSANLREWQVKSIILEHPDKKKHGFQYADWQFEGKDIIAVSRTAYDDGSEGARNFHDANYLTFHRIKNFRKLKSKDNLNKDETIEILELH